MIQLKFSAAERRKSLATAEGRCRLTVFCGKRFPALVRRGMPSRSEGWGGAEREPDRAKHQKLFEDEQYRLILITSASRSSIRWLRVFEQTTPALRAFPSLLRRGIALADFGNTPFGRG
jgi:hypothetical protein